MKTPRKNCRPKTPRKYSKKIEQSFIQQPTSFHNHELIETPQCYSFQQKFMLYQTLTSLVSLKSEQKLNDQTKTCANKLCKNFVSNNNKEKIDITCQNLCQSCQPQFKNQSYCLHCKQVYFDNTDDGKQWIMCEVCQKWVHTQCAQFTIKQCLNITFKCVRCKKVQNQQNTRKYPVRCPVQKVQKKKTLQFLNTLGFQWQLNVNEIQGDIELMKKYLN